MTLANKVTLCRISLIPFFVWSAWAYGDTVTHGMPAEGWRAMAIISFFLAALTDGIDGYIARKYHQKTVLGTILDPIADKGLIATAVIILGLSGWPKGLPVWFTFLVLAKDLLLVVGYVATSLWMKRSPVVPSKWGKAATATQILAVLDVLLGSPVEVRILVYPAAILTVLALLGYSLDTLRKQLSN